MFTHYGCCSEDTMSALILKRFSVALLSLPSASLKLLPWCLRLCALVKMASQSGGIYNSYNVGCHGFMAT